MGLGIPSVHDRFLLGCTIVFALALSAYWGFTSPEDAQEKFYDDWTAGRAELAEKVAGNLLPDPGAMLPPTDRLREETVAAVEGMVERRLAAHDRATSKLSRNLYLQCLALIVAFVVLFGGQEERGIVKVPLLDLKLEVLHVCIALPLVFLWLWVDFGFTVALAIDLRASLWHLLEATEGVGSKSLLNTRIALRDGGFLDVWFQCFRIKEVPPAMDDLSLAIVRIVATLHGLFLSLTHAAAFALLSLGFGPHGTKLKRGSGWLFAWGALLSLALLSFHVGFLKTGQPNWMQLVTALGTPIFLGLYFAFRPDRGSPRPASDAAQDPAGNPVAR
jgi:hypothetical protein